ncbi:MAG: sigma-70 family RNA polymerase sigma factor [Myxococcales bacterium]|nr:sigma-70 family RNA polymerase sigma factor [Myxococcales bacterium]
MPFPSSELDPRIIQCALGRDGAPLRLQQRAFALLHEHYEPAVRLAVGRAVMKLRYTPGAAADLRQEVWCRFAQPRNVLRYFDPKRGSFGPFLSRVSYQQALTIIRQDRRHAGETAQSESYEDDVEDPQMLEIIAQLIQTDFFDALVARARAELDSDERAMLELIYFHDRSALSVARELGINPNTIHKRHQRLKDKLRRWAEELLEQADPRRGKPLVAVLLAVLAILAAASGALAPIDRGVDPWSSPGAS